MNKCIFYPYNKAQAKKMRELEGEKQAHFYQNCLFEIDTSEYPDASTLLLSEDLSKFHEDEKESLLSCYNIYEWYIFFLNIPLKNF